MRDKYYLYFIDDETEAQRGSKAGPGSDPAGPVLTDWAVLLLSTYFQPGTVQSPKDEEVSKSKAIKLVEKTLDFGVAGTICVILGKLLNCSDTQFSHP